MRRITLFLTFFLFSPSVPTIYNIYPISATPVSKDGRALKIVTYNIRGCRNDEGVADPSIIAATLGKLNADVIALQEVDFRLPRSQFVDQVAAIAASLQMNYVYSPSLSLVIGTYGNALLSKLPILGAESMALPATWEPRSMLDVTLDWDGKPLHVYVTHLGLRASEHEEQVESLLTHLEEKQNQTSILLGDFNMLPDDPLLHPVRSLYQDPMFDQHRHFGTLRGKHQGKQIDRIFLSPDLHFLDAAAPKIGHSDHYPVWMQIQKNAPHPLKFAEAEH